MNGPAFPTAIPHDDSKALSAAERYKFNNAFRYARHLAERFSTAQLAETLVSEHDA